MYSFLICDNDERFCRKEKQLIQRFFSEKGISASVDIFLSGREILDLGNRVSTYDAVFLDVNMEESNGIDLGNWIRAAAPNINIVFVSGYTTYVLEGYRVGAIRYIMKEDGQYETSMRECLSYILQKSRKTEEGYITITDEKIRISVEKILYVESGGHKITYHLIKNNDTRQEYSVYGKLDDVERELADFGFYRTHQSFLVNMNYVQNVERYEATLLNGESIPISKRKYKASEDMFIRVRGTF